MKLNEGDLVKYKQESSGNYHYAIIKYIDGVPYLRYNICECAVFEKYKGTEVQLIAAGTALTLKKEVN